jgi:hypothetical protein
MTPKPQTFSLLPGAIEQIPFAANCLTLVSITGAAMASFQFDRGTFEQFEAGHIFQQPFQRVAVRNDNAGAITVRLILSDGPVGDKNSTLLITIAALLTAINDSLLPGTLNLIGDVAVPALPAAGVQLAPANPNRKAVVVFGDATMAVGDLVFIGLDATVSATNKMGAVIQLGQFREATTDALFGVGNNAAIVSVYELV